MNGETASLHLWPFILHPPPMLADGIVEALRLQAHFSGEFDSPMYGELMRRCADDVEQGGPLATLLDLSTVTPVAVASCTRASPRSGCATRSR